MRVLIVRCGATAQSLTLLPPDRAGSGLRPEVVDLPEVPERKDLRFLDDAAHDALAHDPTPSLDQIAAQPDVRHLGKPQPAPQAPHLRERLRVVVAGTDAGLSAVLTRAMRADYLWVEFGYVPVEASPAQRNWSLPIGAGGLPLALHGEVRPAPLIRSDKALAVAGSAVVEEAHGAEYVGEIVVDDHTILYRRPETTTSAAVIPRTGAFGARLVPMTTAPGIAAAPLITPAHPPEGGGLTARWRRLVRPYGQLDDSAVATGRAVQTGGEGIRVTVDAVPSPRPVKRATFYRHLRDLQIVRP